MIKNIKGTKDLLPEETYNIQDIENHLNRFMHLHGYGEIRTPIFESTELFTRSVGQDTDIVNKEMYTWNDQNGQSLTLRPEMTASVVRAYIQKQLWKVEPISKFYYVGPSFRRERPQKGRLRQFHQFGVEAIGSYHPEQDAEIISIAYNIYQMFGVNKLSVKINTLGSNDVRNKYTNQLKKSLSKFKSIFNESEYQRLENNPLRILDSKNKDIQALVTKHAPNIFDYISKEDKHHFETVLQILDAMEIPYTHDTNLVRGLDYYNRTVFEIISDQLGGQDALCGGGRYDNLINELGGADIPAMGFAAGMERLIIAMNLENDQNTQTDIYIINTEQTLIDQSMKLADDIRRNLGVAVYTDSLRRSLKSQLRHANKINSKYTIIIDSNTVENNTVVIKDMEQNQQESVTIDNVISHFESE